jgi:DNA recombination protein RmuC
MVGGMDWLTGMVLVVFGGAVGAAGGLGVGYVLLERRWRGRVQAGEVARGVAEEKITMMAAELERARGESAERVRSLEQALQEERGAAEGAQRDRAAAEARAAGLAAELEGTERNLAEQRALLDEANTRLTQAFATVSREALEQSNAAFLQMAEAKFKTLSTEAAGNLEERKAQIGTLVKPLEEMLGTYQKRLVELEGQRTGAYAELRQQIGTMAATQAALAAQTTQLASALTKPSVRGQWGEVALRRLVELAGMTARCDFVEQPTVGSGSGEDPRLRPDMVVMLPAGRQVVVDCKAVLGAFLEAAAARDEGGRQSQLKRHAGLVRARAKELSSKAYWSQFEQMPEFVVLFLPGEAFLYAACEQDASLLEDCIATKVILATPTTLIALLKSIEYGWRQQQVSENAEEIRRLGAELYDRLSILAENLMKVGGSLEGAVEAFNRTVGTLEARVAVSARKMGDLGARNEKELPVIEVIEKQVRALSTLFE